MNTAEENRRIVADGLERRKAQRLEAEQEAQLERYEQDMIGYLNLHCADAKQLRRMEETDRQKLEQIRARRAAREQAIAQEAEKEMKAAQATRYYGLSCLALLWLTAMTRLPFWAALTVIVGGAVFPAAYIFRLYCPIER